MVGKTTKQKENNMTFADFDEGASSSDGAQGPYINWHARETLDGAISSRSFSIRDEDGGRKNISKQAEKGVVFDLESLKTGWCFSNGNVGVAPEWIWNDSPSRFNQPQPQDVGEERWKKGFYIRVALTKDTAVTWSQAGAGAWAGLVSLMRAVKAAEGEGETAVLKMTGVEEIKFKKGGTSSPNFEFVKWAPRPECLKEAEAPEAPEAPEAAEEEIDEF